MDTSKAIELLTKKIDHINKVVTDLAKQKLKDEKKETWVRVGTIRELTPWTDKRKLEKARKEGLLKQRRGENGIEYLLESIPEIFIKKQTA